MKGKAKVLGIFSLAMITAGSVDSIRNLPATSLFGASLIFFFLIAALFFLLPSALISAELASTSNEDGGVYVWVKNAFGQRVGFLAIWFQWIENVIWYPTILAFVAGTVGYLLAPSLAQSKYFLMSVILSAFWSATIINLLGIRSSARFSNFCAMLGLLFPMCLIIYLGLAWIFSGQPLQIHFTSTSLLPHLAGTHTWVALTGIILSFCGMEIATVHAVDVKNPQRAYPRAMLLATGIILVTLMLGSLAIAVVLPQAKISLVAGIMQAFSAFFHAYHLAWMLPIIALMLVIGGMGGVSNWIIAPTRGLLIAGRDGNLPKLLQRENRFGSPSVLLVGQAVIVSIIALAFLLMPSINGSYWLLTALAAQLYMIMYVMMFVAAIVLRYKNHNQKVGFRIPGKYHLGMWLVAGMGVLGALLTFAIGFVPPSNINIGSAARYEILLLLGLFAMSAPPFLIYRHCQKAQRTTTPSPVTAAESQSL